MTNFAEFDQTCRASERIRLLFAFVTSSKQFIHRNKLQPQLQKEKMMKAKYGMITTALLRSGVVALVFAVLVKAGGIPWPSG